MRSRLNNYTVKVRNKTPNALIIDWGLFRRGYGYKEVIKKPQK